MTAQILNLVIQSKRQDAERTIVIEYIRPPIPTLTCDFQATFEDEVRETTDGRVNFGFGQTPWEALCDLLMWVEE